MLAGVSTEVWTGHVMTNVKRIIATRDYFYEFVKLIETGG